MINKLVDSDGNILTNKSYELFDHTLTSSEPTYWDTAGRRIYFNAVPDTIYAYTCWYTYAPSELSTDAATPEFVPGYEGLIALKAAINSKMIRDEQTREMAQMQYFEDLKSLRLVVMTDQTASSRRVLPSTYDVGE